MKKSILGILVTVVLLLGWRPVARWNMLRDLCRHPGVRHRIAVVPTELVFPALPAPHGVTCNVAYAEFVVPSVQPAHLTRSESSLAVFGEAGTVSFTLLPPFDPGVSEEENGSDVALARLPERHPLRTALHQRGTIGLALEIYSERRTPPSWRRVLAQREIAFACDFAMLSTKRSCTGMGMHSVHTYTAPGSRGLIRVGKSTNDARHAHVHLLNREATQSVGMFVNVSDDSQGSVTNVLAMILGTFRFAGDELGTPEEIQAMMTHAGIQPRRLADTDESGE